jgi:hypothetical protein
MLLREAPVAVQNAGNDAPEMRVVCAKSTLVHAND